MFIYCVLYIGSGCSFTRYTPMRRTGLDFTNSTNILPPSLEGFALLVCPIVPLIDTCNPRFGSADMVQCGLGDFKPNT